MQRRRTFWLVPLLLALACLPLQTRAIGGDGLYFMQNFEDASQYPDAKNGEEQAFNVEGQGEWLYYNAFQSTNSSYNENGSTMNLRMPKSGSYVVTPVLTNGVSRVTFYIGRASVKAYTSTDGGQTWTEAAITTTGKTCTVTVESNEVNRVKLANDASKDADIDNIAVYAQTFDQPVRVSTGDATNITTTSASVSGTITENSGEDILGAGFVWSIVNKQPTRSDNDVSAKMEEVYPPSRFVAELEGLKQGSTIYYRAYVLYADTYAYGDVKSFKVAVEASEQTVNADGTYFVQDFEDDTAFPQTSGAQDAEYYVAGQGTWIYNNAFASTNSSYNLEGSKMNLRLPKNGSYVVTPVLNYGVKAVSYYGPRKGDKLTCYTSKDGGSTWTQVAQTSDGNNNFTVTVGDLEVNRIKIANDGSGDADIDNLTVTAQAYGTPAIVETGAATDVTKNTAVLTGTIVDAGDQPIQESGFVWSTVNAVPTLADNAVETEDPTDMQLSVMITGLKAEQTVYYRAYALSNAGYAYGDVRSFQTTEATMPVVQTQEVVKSGSRYKATGVVTDDGGMDLLGVGFVYGTTPQPADLNGVAPTNGDDNSEVIALDPKAKFTATLTLADNTTYYIRAYAQTAKGIATGEQITFKTDEVQEKPDEIVGDEIWCSPDGDDTMADGSEAKPFFDLQKAIDIAEPGDRIWMKAGTYVYDKRINIDDHNGTAEAPIQVFAYGGRAVLDFSGMPYHKHSDNPYQGVRLTSSYWHFYKIDITNASDNGMLIERNKPTGGSASDIIARTQDGHDNIIEQCNFYRNGDTGLQMKNLGAYNYVINCDSYENKDESDGDADGFAPKISVGDGNYFFGCRAWNNSDDGYDVFFKKTGGFEDNKTIIMEYCLAYENGIMSSVGGDLKSPTSGNGNGFKMGSDQGRMNCILNRCLAVRNLNKGFDQNHNSGDIIMNNCTGIGQTDVGGKSYSYRIYEALASGSVCEIQNSIAINDRLTTDKSESDMGKRGTWGRFEVTVASKEEACDWKAAPACFIDMTHPEQLIGPRQDDGTLPEVDYAHISLETGSQYVDAGVLVEANDQKYAAANVVIPAVEFAGQAPDLGAYETDFMLADAAMPKEPTVLPEMPTAIDGSTINTTDRQLTVRQTRDGLFIVAVVGHTAQRTNAYTLRAYTADGRLIGARTFNGATVVSLPRVKGEVIFTVSGQGLNMAKKLAVR